MRRLLFVLALAAPLTAHAESSLPFLKDLVGDRELPPPWGIGIDYYTMDQDYSIDELTFRLPGVSLPDTSSITVTNDVQHYDFKADVWLFPFLNVFALVGHVESDTVVDLTKTPIVGLPPGFPGLGKLAIRTDGTVLGVGGTLAYGGDNWFTSVTFSYTDTDLGGDFDSSAETFTAQPRIGMIRGPWIAWVGALYIDVEEKHSGTINLPGLGAVEFAAVLGAQDEWNSAVGVRHQFSEKTSLSLEVGFGDRKHTLFNFNWRF